MSNFDDIRKLFQDFLAPELRTLTEKVESLRIDQGQIRHDMSAMEARILHAIEQAKTEILLTTKIADLEQRLS